MNEIVNVFDFNSVPPIGHNFPITDRKGMTNAFRANHFFSTHELFPETRIQQMRSPVPRRVSNSKLFVFRPIQLYHAGSEAKFLEARWPMPTKTGLAYLRGLRSCVDPNGQRVLCKRGLRTTNHPSGLRSGFHHDRPLPVPFSVGLFSETKRRHQTPYRDGSARLYPLRNPHHSWESSRCYLLGSVSPRTQRFLRHGPWIHRFCSPLSFTQNMAFFVTRAKSNLDYI